jgi:oligopeptidase B
MPVGWDESSQPPKAPRRPHTVYLGNVEGQLRGHDVSRLIDPPIGHEDDLFWLRDDARASEEVLEIMKAEKAHTEAVTARLQVEGGPVDRLFNELRARLKETDTGVPYKEGPFLRYERTVAGKSYPLHCRVVAGNSPDTVDTATLFLALQKGIESGDEKGITGEEVLLDENLLAVELATSSSDKMVDDTSTAAEDDETIKQEGDGEPDGGSTTCDVRTVKVSPDGAQLAYSVDGSGTEVFEIRFKRLAWRVEEESSSQKVAAVPVPAPASASASLLQDCLKNTNGECVFGADSSTVFYLTLDPMQRPDRLWRHVLGAPQSSDACLFHEKDDRFWTSICRSRSGDFVFFRTTSKTSSEVWAIPLTERAKAAAAQGGAKQAVAVPAAIACDSSQEAAVHDNELLSHHSALPLIFVIEPRSEDVLYDVDHYVSPSRGGQSNEPMGKRQRTSETLDIFVILTNKEGATNFKLCIARVRDPRQWVELLPHCGTRHLQEIDTFGAFWQLTGREDGYAQIFVSLCADVEAACTSAFAQATPTMRLQRLPARDAVFFFEQSINLEYNAESLRFVYSSPTCPPMTCEYRPGVSMAPPVWPANNGVSDAAAVATIVVLKQKEVPGVDLTAYATARLFAPAKDGRSIPISVLYRPSTHEIGPSIDGESSNSGENAPFTSPSPLVLYGYGAYGLSWDPEFTSSSLSLCDRGVVFAIAHVRGGAELGRTWYDEGKMLKKHKTFSDFIECAEHLVMRGWTTHGRIIAEGGSAGGLLIGVVANSRPDLWAGCIAQCPFLDGVVTMCDSSIPLVSTEWNEWGNPNIPEELEAIRAYDPMINIKGQNYPPLLIEAGLNDTRVAYWEPLKFVQRVRAATTGNPRHVMFKVEMDEGHTGAMDRYKHIRDRAFELAWGLECLGKDA